MPTIFNSIVKLAAPIALAATVGAGLATAEELQGRQTLKPLQALSVEAGAKHGIGYFVNHQGSCKVVVTIAEHSAFGSEEDFAATRFETIMAPGTSKVFALATPSLVMQCEEGANAMTIGSRGQVAVK